MGFATVYHPSITAPMKVNMTDKYDIEEKDGTLTLVSRSFREGEGSMQ